MAYADSAKPTAAYEWNYEYNDYPNFAGNKIKDIPCLNKAFDEANPLLKNQPRALSCPCPKCTPYC